MDTKIYENTYIAVQDLTRSVWLDQAICRYPRFIWFKRKTEQVLPKRPTSTDQKHNLVYSHNVTSQLSPINYNQLPPFTDLFAGSTSTVYPSIWMSTMAMVKLTDIYLRPHRTYQYKKNHRTSGCLLQQPLYIFSM